MSSAPTHALEIRPVTPAELAPIRHAVLWPSIPPDAQLLPYDFLPTTIHLGAFESGALVGCLTLTVEAYKGALPSPPSPPFPSPTDPTFPTLPYPARQVQLHKFAVLPHLQGKGIGRALFLAAAAAIHAGPAPALLHFDARANQQGFYARLGAGVLDPATFETRGPTGTATPVTHIRMGMVV
ncbi:hypothetical protein Q5752_006076 [Cryptotrichosporon argae]